MSHRLDEGDSSMEYREEEATHDILRDSLYTLFSDEDISKQFAQFFVCSKKYTGIMRDLLVGKIITQEEVEALDRLVSPEAFEDFLRTLKKNPVAQVLEVAIYGGMRKIFIRNITLYKTLFCLDAEQDSQNTVSEDDDLVCEHRETEFSVWSSLETENFYLKLGNAVLTEVDAIEGDRKNQEGENGLEFVIFTAQGKTFIYNIYTKKLDVLEGDFYQVYEKNGLKLVLASDDYQNYEAVEESKGGEDEVKHEGETLNIFDTRTGISFYMEEEKGFSMRDFFGVGDEIVVIYSYLETRESFRTQNKKRGNSHVRVMIDTRYAAITLTGEKLGDFAKPILGVYKTPGDIIFHLEGTEDFDPSHPLKQGKKFHIFFSHLYQEEGIWLDKNKKMEIVNSPDDMVFVIDNGKLGKDIFAPALLLHIPVRTIEKIEIIGGNIDIEFTNQNGTPGVYNTSLVKTYVRGRLKRSKLH